MTESVMVYACAGRVRENAGDKPLPFACQTVAVRGVCAQLFEFRGGRPPEGASSAKGGAASADSSDGSGTNREVLLHYLPVVCRPV